MDIAARMVTAWPRVGDGQHEELEQLVNILVCQWASEQMDGADAAGTVVTMQPPGGGGGGGGGLDPRQQGVP